MKKFNVCIVGGGSTYTLGFLKSFVRLKEEFPLNKLVLFDINKERQEPIGKYGDIMFSERYPELEFAYTTDPKTAYEGMDFIFMQMRAGGLQMRREDEHIPLSMGLIGQETCGAGGMAYGLRSCVDMIEAIHQIRTYSPNAWILNYSNPAAIVAEALRREFPDDKRILNICDQPENVVRSTSRLLGCSWEDLDPVYFGLNHFGWFTSIEYKGENVMDKLRQYIHEHEILLPAAYLKDKAALQSKKGSEQNRHTKGSWYYVWKGVYEIMENFPEKLPNTYLNYYLQAKEFVEHSDPNRTRANEVMETRESNLFEGIKKYQETGVIDETVVYAGSHGDWIADLAIALKNDTKARFLVITENRGAIPNMPYDAMVEVVCELGINGPRPMRVGSIPQFYLGLLVQQVSCEKLLVDAFYEHSYQKALQAFTLNRLINDAKKARKVLDALIEANKGMWPELK